MAPITTTKKILFTATVFFFSSLVAIALGEIYVRFLSGSEYVTPEVLKRKSLRYAETVFARHVFPEVEQRLVGRS